ncbi:protoporphyrinogen/coproporphyrinogen oxidase [Microbacterium sp. gxy059]|uniref:protoporphyrinogen/coproporphyrinogen oxidase n=1 Tax=Microbacterium sp. gxy059 TaxID=2957199 RepID=UPI003D9999CB
MTDEKTPDLVALHERAAETRVVVVGAGIGGLVAALEFAKLGMGVTVVEAAERAGGAIRSGEVAGLTLDLGAESFATRGGHVAALVEELGLSDEVVAPGTGAGGAWVAGVPGVGAAPLPAGGVLGIPGTPFAPDVRRIIGTAGAWRAYLDRLRPVLTIGHDRSLGHLVASRLGRRVLDRLVAPVTTGVYSAAPESIDPDVAAPGLNQALTRAGSLTGAVLDLAEARRTAPGGAVKGLRGGMGRLVDALVEALAERGVEVRLGTPARAIEEAPDAADARPWRVVIDAPAEGADGSADARPVAEPGEEPRAAGDASTGRALGAAADAGSGASDGSDPGATAVGDDAGSGAADWGDGSANPAGETPAPAFATLEADAVVVATEEGPARRLLAPLSGSALAAEPPHPGPVVDVVTLVVSAPALDRKPRGTGVLTVPGSFRAKALTHATAKWQWVADAADPGAHVVRVSFGTAAEAPAMEGLDEAQVADLAREEASALLGVDIAPGQVLGARRERFSQSQPAATQGHAEATARARDAIREIPGIGAVGAWLAGTGLAQVVPDAAREAERVRRALLFADDADE